MLSVLHQILVYITTSLMLVCFKIYTLSNISVKIVVIIQLCVSKSVKSVYG